MHAQCCCVHICLQLQEVTIYQIHSLESTIGFECPRKSFTLFVRLFPLTITFELLLSLVQEIVLLSAPSFFISCTCRHLPVFLVASVTYIQHFYH